MTSELSTPKDTDSTKLTIQRNKLISLEERLEQWQEKVDSLKGEKTACESLILELEEQIKQEQIKQEQDKKTYEETLKERFSQQEE